MTTHQLVVDPGGPTADDVQPVKNETADRIATGTITALPFIALGIVCWQLWNSWLHWSDVAVFAIMYLICAMGVTVGFHRHLTHRSFKAKKPVRFALAAMGSIAIEGPVISWVADHRKHHAFSDQEGDPHSPHVGHGGGWHGTLHGLFHAHLGWLFVHDQRGKRSRYAPDLLTDPALRFIDRTFFVWVAAGLGLPFVIGYALGGTLAAGLSGLVWGGLVRMAVLHHVTFSINSLCHTFGRRRFETTDESRNLAWLALPSMGEAWHNNHHAFPTSAAHGFRAWEIDPSALLIAGLERTGLAWDVQRISRERQERRYGS